MNRLEKGDKVLGRNQCYDLARVTGENAMGFAIKVHRPLFQLSDEAESRRSPPVELAQRVT